MERIDFGVKKYSDGLVLQLTYFEELIKKKKEGKSEGREYLLTGEHTPVITIGRRGKETNVLLREEILKDQGVEVYKTTRGGDVTYHCPGQLVAYPIIDLERHHLGVKDYVNLLEESVIELLEKYGINGERIEGATGVWIDKGTAIERKICAIGVKCSHYCTMHGMALNVNADLRGFSMINPCGFTDKGVTSMSKELERSVDFEKVKDEFSDIFFRLLNS